MAYVSVPKDLNAVKTKVLFNLTKRQLICFGGGALIGVPLFFILKNHIATSGAALCMMVVMLPAFLFGMYEKNGQPLEKIIRNNELRNQEEKEAQYIATALEIYVTGSLNVFNHRTNVDIHSRVVCYDIKELGKQLKKIGMLIVQDA